MKTRFTPLTFLSLICLFAINARSAVVLQDSFSYADGVITNVSSMLWTNHSGLGDFLVDTGRAKIAGGVSSGSTGDVAAYLTNAPYATNGPVTALYAKFTINVSTLPNSSGTYFAHFKDTGTANFRGRVFVLTGGAASGFYRIGIANSGGTQTNLTVDLSPGTSYTVVVRYVLSTGVASLWLNPASETNAAITATDPPGLLNISTFAMRQATSQGILFLDDLVVGTTFGDVVPGSINPPSILNQPADNTTPFEGATVSFSTLAAGDTNLFYQWYFNTNTLLTASPSMIGVTSNVLTLTNISVAQSGTYDCVVSNAAGTNVTRYAVLFVNTTPIPPVITNQPVGVTANVGDTANFSVVAGGSQPLSYQWKVVPVTNNLVTNIVSGATSATLSIPNLSTNLSGNQYFVTVTNQFGLTNSAKAVLTVNPPPVLTVAQFRAKVDGAFAPTNTTAIYTLQGIVTTWNDMTGLANTEFYMQDGTGGIVVFWSGANGATNLPPAGALVRVTGPMAAFSGLLEISPVFTNALHSVIILSTNNPLPKAQPLPFDPNVSGYPATAKNATMDKLEGMYLVASNVMLNLSTPAFVSGANDIITNNVHHVLSATNSVATINFTNEAGQQFILFINAQAGIAGQTKYAGPVTIYGVLGYFTSAGYEFTPSRFEDIVSYNRTTNVVTNVKRYGDLLTNAYTENVLRTGETLTTSVNIGDAEGGTVTLTPVVSGLPATASWSGVSNGLTAAATFQFTAVATNEGNNYIIKLGVSSTSGTSFTNSFSVYVPTAAEQKICVAEFLANPTTNAGWANFNPLHRSTDTIGIITNDMYLELVNQSDSDLDTTDWLLQQGNATVVDFDAFGLPPVISSSNAIVIYGGNQTETPSLPVSSYKATSAGGLRLPTTGSGTIILRNQDPNHYIVDRVVYSGGSLSTNGSLTRFPTIASPFVPQPYVSTNLTTAGRQYDGSAWNLPYKVPAGVTNVVVGAAPGQVILNFSADTGKASTLWGADVVTGPYQVLFGKQFPTTSGSFTNPIAAPAKFYYITTQ